MLCSCFFICEGPAATPPSGFLQALSRTVCNSDSHICSHRGPPRAESFTFDLSPQSNFSSWFVQLNHGDLEGLI